MVQGHLFDDVLEPKDISLFDYLNKSEHYIVSFRMFAKVTDFWIS